MGEIVNLRRARKRRERAEKASVAAAHRVLYGRTKAQKQAERNAAERAQEVHEAHRREPSSNGGERPSETE